MTDLESGITIIFQWKIGTKVTITELKTAGVVRKVLWNGHGREYQVSYFINGESKLEWFYEDQLS